MKDLICIGLTTLDVSVRPVQALPKPDEPAIVEDISLTPAGTAGGTAVIAAKLGLDAGIISAIGDDNNGAITKTLLEEASVDTRYLSVIPGMRSSTTVLTIRPDGERPNFHMMGASLLSEFSEEGLTAAEQTKVLHLAGVGFPHLSGDAAVDALARLKSAGVMITCDLIAPQPNTLEILERMLPHVDVFMPSRAEVSVMLGEVSAEDALQKFTGMGAKHCFIKLGEEGAIGLLDGEIVKFPAHNITPVDTTSCGDSFCAGVIYGLCQNMPLVEAGKLGIATASFVAQGAGTLGALTGIEQVKNLMGAA